MDENSSSPEELIKKINDLVEKAENAAREAEDANRKANSESGFAYNAKSSAEEHARTISQIKGAVEADIAWLSTTKKNAEDMIQAISNAKASSESDSRISNEAKINAEQDAASIKSANERIKNILSTIEKIQTDSTNILRKVTEESATIHEEKATAEAKTSAIQELATETSEKALKATADASSIAKIESKSQSLFDSMSEIFQTSQESHNRVIDYEKKLKTITESFNDLHKKVEGLLPNATSAGLASAFRNQKERFKDPQRFWLISFIVAMGLLMLIGGRGFYDFSIENSHFNSWNSVFRYLAIRLPLVAPLIWLAIYAGRHYSLALRVEEEYAFKEAISTSFEGYKREMAGISDIGENTLPPLITLCENVLRTLAQRPGRIYEGRQEDITPLSPISRLIEKTTPVSNDSKK